MQPSSRKRKAEQRQEKAEQVIAESNTVFGLCGLGDAQSAISLDVFKHCTQHDYFVKTLAQDWSSSHSEAVANDAVEPLDSRPSAKCSDFCMTTGLYGVNQTLFARAKNLLQDITWSLKPLYKEIKKNIDRRARHPLLLARCVKGNVTCVKGWLITYASFRPMRLDSIELEVSSCLDTPALLDLKRVAVPKSSEGMQLFAFSSSSVILQS